VLLYTGWNIVEHVAKATIQVNDKKFRIVIPQDIRTLENINVGDFIEIDVKKIKKPKEKEST